MPDNRSAHFPMPWNEAAGRRKPRPPIMSHSPQPNLTHRRPTTELVLGGTGARTPQPLRRSTPKARALNTNAPPVWSCRRHRNIFFLLRCTVLSFTGPNDIGCLHREWATVKVAALRVLSLMVVGDISEVTVADAVAIARSGSSQLTTAVRIMLRAQRTAFRDAPLDSECPIPRWRRQEWSWRRPRTQSHD